MVESEAEAIWSAIREFILGLQRHDPTIRRWIAAQSNADLLLDIYGEEGLLTLLKEYREQEDMILLRIAAVPQEKGPVRQAEIAWVAGKRSPPRREDRVSLQLRKVRRRWQVEDIWPTPLDAALTIDQARALVARQEEHADPAAVFLAGAMATPPEGCGALDDVETLFVLGMASRGYSPREVVRAVRLWRDFGQATPPSYRRPAPLAAAVEYAFSLLGLYGECSQRQIAAAYGVPVGSVGRCFAQLRGSLGLVFGDPRYSAWGPAPASSPEHGPGSGSPLRGKPDNPILRYLP